MTSISENKSAKIQVLRGLAIIVVVFIHITPGGMTQVIFRPFLNIAVGLFLFLSGMLSDAKRWKPMKRLIKILIPYTIWTFAYTLTLSYKYPDRIIRNYLHHLLFGNSAAIMYYVFVYCEFTLLIPLIDKLARSRYKYFGFIISPIEIVCIRLIPIVYGIQVNKYISTIASLSCLGWFTYFYLGYLLGNNYISVKTKTRTIASLWAISLLLQMLEGYWYLSMGIANCGTQLKLSAVLSGSLFCILAFRYVESDCSIKPALLMTLGNYSFGIYFSHLFIKKLLSVIPGYTDHVFYPLSAIILVMISLLVVMAGHKILGRFAKYIAF